jgi:hypothetical protein
MKYFDAVVEALEKFKQDKTDAHDVANCIEALIYERIYEELKDRDGNS